MKLVMTNSNGSSTRWTIGPRPEQQLEEQRQSMLSLGYTETDRRNVLTHPSGAYTVTLTLEDE